MASIVNVTVSPVTAASARTGRPTRLFRGRTRTEMRKTIAKLQALFNADSRAQRRATALGYQPALVCGLPNSSINNAFVKTLNRLVSAMGMKTGDA